MGRECSRLWEVDAYRERRLGAKDAQAFERHLAACAACTERMRRDEGLRRRLRDVPADEPSELDLRRTRARVLRDLATGPRLPRRATRAAAALVLGAAGIVAWLAVPASRPQDAPVASAPPAAVVAGDAPREPFAGSVAALAESRWTQSRADGVERVTLQSGWVRVHVRPQHAGERFLVALPDGELEVRGTTFEVTVEGSATKDVHVDEGVVELRLAGAPPRRLAAGELWRSAPAVVAASTPPLPVPPPVVAARPAAAPVVAAPPPAIARAGSDEYTAAVELLGRGRNAEASGALEAFVLAHPAAPQVEDATYLDAVALARAGRNDAAALAAEQHLRRFPRSFHRKEAATIVALAAAARGDCARARGVVAEWSIPESEVEAALRACPSR